MLENESEILERIYGIDIFMENSRKNQIEKKRLHYILGNIDIRDYINEKAKKYIILGLEIFIIAAHIVFFVFRLLNF